MFVGDTTELARNFEVYFSGSVTDWAIGLKPRSGTISRMLKQMVLRGGAVVNEGLRISEGSGDQSVILFSGVMFEPAKLSAREQGYFDALEIGLALSWALLWPARPRSFGGSSSTASVLSPTFCTSCRPTNAARSSPVGWISSPTRPGASCCSWSAIRNWRARAALLWLGLTK